MNEQRIIDLEIRFSHQDDFIHQLNEVVVKQQQTIDRMEKEIIDLKKVVSATQGVETSGRTLADDKPPHY